MILLNLFASIIVEKGGGRETAVGVYNSAASGRVIRRVLSSVSFTIHNSNFTTAVPRHVPKIRSNRLWRSSGGSATTQKTEGARHQPFRAAVPDRANPTSPNNGCPTVPLFPVLYGRLLVNNQPQLPDIAGSPQSRPTRYR